MNVVIYSQHRQNFRARGGQKMRAGQLDYPPSIEHPRHLLTSQEAVNTPGPHLTWPWALLPPLHTLSTPLRPTHTSLSRNNAVKLEQHPRANLIAAIHVKREHVRRKIVIDQVVDVEVDDILPSILRRLSWLASLMTPTHQPTLDQGRVAH